MPKKNVLSFLFVVVVVDKYCLHRLCRHGIVDQHFISVPGGLDVIEVFFNNNLIQEVLSALQSLKPGQSATRNKLISETLDRAEKYIGR